MSDIVSRALEARRGLYGDLHGVEEARTPTDEPRISPVTMFVTNLSEQMGKKFYTAKDVAVELGVSVQAVRKYAANEVCGKNVAPSYKAKQGKMVVYLYTEDDVEALKQYLGGRSSVVKLSEE